MLEHYEPNILNMFPLSKAADYLPLTASGNRQHPGKIHAWRARGVRGVRLQCQRIGGCWYTSRAWIDEFISRLSNPDLAPTATTPARITKQHHESELELEAAGI